MLAAARCGLIGVFVVPLLFGAEPNESQAGIIPATTENASASYAKVIRIDQRADKVALPHGWSAIIVADSLRHGKLDVETNFCRKLAGQILGFAPGENEMAKVIMFGGTERQHPVPMFNKFGRNSTFDYGCLCVADIDRHVMDCFSDQMNVPQDDARPMRRNKFLPSKLYSFACQASLSISYNYQTEGENPDCDRSEGGNSPVVVLKKGYDRPKSGAELFQQRGLLIPLVFLAILIALPIIGWLAAREIVNLGCASFSAGG
jgi:hypothetical protein